MKHTHTDECYPDCRCFNAFEKLKANLNQTVYELEKVRAERDCAEARGRKHASRDEMQAESRGFHRGRKAGMEEVAWWIDKVAREHKISPDLRDALQTRLRRLANKQSPLGSKPE